MSVAGRLHHFRTFSRGPAVSINRPSSLLSVVANTARSGHTNKNNFFPQMNADKHRCFLAFACGEANKKRFKLLNICVHLWKKIILMFFEGQERVDFSLSTNYLECGYAARIAHSRFSREDPRYSMNGLTNKNNIFRK